MSAPEPTPSDHADETIDAALPPLFWDGDGDEWLEESSPEFAALRAIVEDANRDATPREIAERCKEKGNSSVKYGVANKLYARYAVEHYTAGLAAGCDDDALNGTLYCNRAHAGLLLKNHRKAHRDAVRATEMIPRNVKGWFRAAKAALALEMVDECARCCVGGLEIEGDNRELKVMLREAKRLVEKREKQATLDAEEKVRIRAYVETLKAKKIRLGPATLGSGERFPTVDPSTSAATYWTLFVYPESMQTDVVEAASEISTLGEHLDVLFNPAGPPLEWDSRGHYTRDSVEVYWQTNAAVPYTWEQVETKMLDAAGLSKREADDDTRKEIEAMAKGGGKVDSRDQFMRRIDPKIKLGDLFREKEFVIAGHPVLYVVAKGTEFHQQFLNGEWEL
jgi:hypothetical protein|tara:strand:+ start:3396 stop:4577 length:1182 start_codon:yes stop_codon:yes gene_type:complete